MIDYLIASSLHCFLACWLAGWLAGRWVSQLVGRGINGRASLYARALQREGRESTQRGGARADAPTDKPNKKKMLGAL